MEGCFYKKMYLIKHILIDEKHIEQKEETHWVNES